MERFKRNNITNADGKFSFLGLSPGRYFLKPVLKEYEFQPSFLSFTLEDGATFDARFAALRVAYSVKGIARTLSGYPLAGVTIEATATTADGDATMEDAKSDSTGAFRVRGLVPGLEYTIGVKAGESVKASTGKKLTVERGFPADVKFTPSASDLEGVKFTVFGAAEKAFASITAEVSDEVAAKGVKVAVFAGDATGKVAKRLSLVDVPITRYIEIPLSRGVSTYSFQLSVDVDSRDWSVNAPVVAATVDELDKSPLSLSLSLSPHPASQQTSQANFWSLLFVVVAIAGVMYRDQITGLFAARKEGTRAGEPKQGIEQYGEVMSHLKHHEKQKSKTHYKKK